MKKLIKIGALLAALAASTGPALADDVSASGTSASDATSGASAGSVAQSGDQTIVFGGSHIPKNTPEVIAGPSNNTAMCIESTSLGVSLAGLGGSISVPTQNKDCTVNVRADLLIRAGRMQAAVAYLALNDPGIKAALEQNEGVSPIPPAAPAR